MNNTPFQYIEKESDLKDLQKKIQDTQRVAVDTEADSLHHYFEKMCLVQISFLDRHYVVDPLAGLSLDKFMESLSKKELIFHGADFDLQMLKNSYGFKPKMPIFDTMLASQYIGLERFGLAALVEKFCGVKLSKEGQKSNWARRPLTPKQLQYASDDTRYLERVAEDLAKSLEKLKREAWHEEACSRVVDVVTQRKEKTGDDLWRIKGAGVLDRKTLAYLKEMWHWRDCEARKINRPSFMVINNQLLIELSKWLAGSGKGAFYRGPKLPKNLIGRRYQELEKVISKVKKLNPEKWPERKKFGRKMSQEDKDRIDKVRKECQKIAQGLKIEPAFLAARSAIQSIVLARPNTISHMMEVSGLMRWQTELVFDKIKRTLQL